MSDNNRTFFKKSIQGQMSLGDIFSDVSRKHTPEESARVLIAGTALTTPDESEMLAGWQKPFLFARFALATLACMVLFMLLGGFAKGAQDAFLACMAFMVPMVMLILTWEMNIPRSISLMEILKVVAIGGALSLAFAIVMFFFDLSDGFFNAPIAEEPAKFAVVYLLLKRKNRKYILEGMLLGMAVGTGFAIVETFGYIMGSSRDALIDAVAKAIVAGRDVTYAELYNISFEEGLSTAVLRLVNAFAGHGFYAALYSGGIMIAKGAEPVNAKHIFSPSFLICFAVSCVLHGLNNSDVPMLFPILYFGNYVILTYSFVQTAIAIVFLLGMYKRGVNQVIQACTAHNQGRVTIAVNRNVANVNLGGGSQPSGGRVEFVSGPLAGQSFPLHQGMDLVIGRSPSCTIPVTGASSVSGKHCTVNISGSMILVTDLGSTNGTYLGSQRLAPQQPTPVPDGGVIYLGSKSCAFRVSSR